MSVILAPLPWQVDVFVSLVQGVVRMSAVVAVGFAFIVFADVVCCGTWAGSRSMNVVLLGVVLSVRLILWHVHEINLFRLFSDRGGNRPRCSNLCFGISIYSV